VKEKKGKENSTLLSFTEKNICKRKEKKIALCFPLLKKIFVKEKKRKENSTLLSFTEKNIVKEKKTVSCANH
jgi:hypothetical protein